MKRLPAFILLLAAAAAHAQQVYRWTDKDGKVQYGQSPPPGVSAKAIQGTGNTAASSRGTSSTVGGQQHAVQSNATPLREGEVKPGFDPRKKY